LLASSANYTACFASLALTAYILPAFTSRPSISLALGTSIMMKLCQAMTYWNSVALYGLFLFYGLTKEELEGRRPLAKFLSIKLIVMFTFYQSFIVSYLRLHGYPIMSHLGSLAVQRARRSGYQRYVLVGALTRSKLTPAPKPPNTGLRPISQMVLTH
jgi:hypothetical protein